MSERVSKCDPSDHPVSFVVVFVVVVIVVVMNFIFTHVTSSLEPLHRSASKHCLDVSWVNPLQVCWNRGTNRIFNGINCIFWQFLKQKVLFNYTHVVVNNEFYWLKSYLKQIMESECGDSSAIWYFLSLRMTSTVWVANMRKAMFVNTRFNFYCDSYYFRHQMAVENLLN